jgi:hypothetical protein
LKLGFELSCLIAMMRDLELKAQAASCCRTGQGKTTNNEEGACCCCHISRRRADKGGGGQRRAEEGKGGQRSGHAREAPTHLKNLACCSVFLAACDSLLGGGRSKKKLLCPNLNHSIPKVGTKQLDRGTNTGSKTSHTLAHLGNMM